MNQTPAKPDFWADTSVLEAIGYFQTKRLSGVTAEQFETRIRGWQQDLEVPDEDIPEGGDQKITSRKFLWGHDHDFGTFQINGALGTRHIWLTSRLFREFGVSPVDFEGRRVLDIGCYTGAVSLILQQLGAEVTACDDLRRYVGAVDYLRTAFAVERLRADTVSVYDLIDHWGPRQFDAIVCFGLVYHLTDPLLALRILYHLLEPGGMLYLETMAFDHPEPVCEFLGPAQGFNWFCPSPRCLSRWLEDTGFEVLQVGDGVTPYACTGVSDPLGPGRTFAIARRLDHHSMTAAGLSQPRFAHSTL